jgi:hypothetical protein
MWGVGVVLGVDGDCTESQFGCGSDDPERDLTTIGDQQAHHIRSFVGLTISHPHHIIR